MQGVGHPYRDRYAGLGRFGFIVWESIIYHLCIRHNADKERNHP